MSQVQEENGCYSQSYEAMEKHRCLQFLSKLYDSNKTTVSPYHACSLFRLLCNSDVKLLPQATGRLIP